MTRAWLRSALLGAGVALAWAEAASEAPLQLPDMEMVNATAPMELSSYGCQACCSRGQCFAAYKHTPGVCCSSHDGQCCPNYYNGQGYHCVSTGFQLWGCAPSKRPAPPPPPPHHTPAPAPVRRRRTYVPAPPPPAKVCTRETGGTCSMLSCKSSRGQTDCVSGKCLCKPGYCSLGGVCVSEGSCPKSTPGTCSMFGCGSKRGEVDCVSGKCVCKTGACAHGGVCYLTCPKDTGGTCRHLSCKGWRGAECQHGSCLCGAGLCSFDGQCMPGVRAAAMEFGEGYGNTTLPVELAEMQQSLDGALVLCLVAGFVLSAGLIVFIASRKRADDEGYKALIQTEA